LAAHWADYLRTRAGLRDSRALIRQHRAFLKEAGPRLAAYLAQHQAFLAGTGRDGAFDPWLRSLKIPPSTAYSLIERFANPNKPKKLKSPWDCPNFARDVPRPGPVSLVFKGHRLAMKLSVRQTAPCATSSRTPPAPKRPPSITPTTFSTSSTGACAIPRPPNHAQPQTNGQRFESASENTAMTTPNSATPIDPGPLTQLWGEFRAARRALRQARTASAAFVAALCAKGTEIG